MDTYSSIVGFFQNGGLFMYPIILVLAAGLAIAIERYMYLSATQIRSNALWKEVTPFIKAGKFSEAVVITRKSKAAIGTILTYGLNRIKTARRRDDPCIRIRLDSLGEVGDNILEADLRQDRHAVPLALPVVGRFIAALGKRQGRKGVVGQFRLLQQQDVGLYFVDPGFDPFLAGSQGIHVPRDDSHLSCHPWAVRRIS